MALQAVSAPDDKPAVYPKWWFERGVIRPLDANKARPLWAQGDFPAPDDFGAANVGQLKQVATAAYDELKAWLPGGAGTQVAALVKSWYQLDPATGDFLLDAQGHRQPKVVAATDDFAAINLGQLKTVAKPFYDRLIAVQPQVAYPWAGGAADDYAMANLGQVKVLFSFNLRTDGNFLPGSTVGAIESGMGGGNPHPDRLGDGGSVTPPPTSGTPAPGGGGDGPPMDAAHDPTKSGAMKAPTITVWSGDDPSEAHIAVDVHGAAYQGLQFQRRDGQGGWNIVGLSGDMENGYDDTTLLLANMSHLYRVLVTFPNGEALFSNVVNFTPALIVGTPVSHSAKAQENPGFQSFREVVGGGYQYYFTTHDHSEENDTDTGFSGVYDVFTTIDPVTGTLSYAGYSTYTDQNGTKTATIGVDGSWSSEDGPPFTGGYRVALMEVNSPTSMSTPDDPNMSTWETLEDEYTAEQFYADFIENMPEYDEYTHGVPPRAWFWPPPYDPSEAEMIYRWRWEHNGRFALRKARYQVWLNPSAPATVAFYDIFVPFIFGDGTNSHFEEAQIIAQHNINCNASGADAGPYEIDVTAQPSYGPDGVDGYYYFMAGMQVGLSGNVVDNSVPGGLNPAGYSGNSDLNSGSIVVSPPDSSGSNAVNANVGIASSLVPGATYTISISNSADFIVTGPGGRLGASQTFDYSELGVLTIAASGSAADGEVLTITIQENVPGQPGTSVTVRVTNRLAAGKDLSVPLDEASGSRYRKIALNGRPMADEKPQQTAESDEEKEESYVDALTLGLHHSTTDVYVPVPGCDLALMARRDTLSETWNMRSGLRPHERLDRPFGAGWTSNLCAHLEDYAGATSAYTYVVDQNGARHRFAKALDPNDSTKSYYVPVPSDSRENSDYLTTLVKDENSDNRIFTDRYGTKIIFDANQTFTVSVAENRYAQHGLSETKYTLVAQIADRLGNTFVYSYPNGARTLIPQQITANGVLTLSVAQDTTGHITSIWDPNGNQFTYSYGTRTYTYNGVEYGEKVLTGVTGPDNQTTTYDYNMDWEADQTPADLRNGQPVDKAHLDISLIRDPSENQYTFTYTFDQTRYTYNTVDGYYPETGAPRCVATVNLPAPWGSATFSNAGSRTKVDTRPDAQGHLKLTGDSNRISTIQDAAGSQITYTWTGTQIFNMGSLETNGPPPKIVFYTAMDIAYNGFGHESFTFDPTAGLALQSVTDFSSNTTTYAYTQHYAPPADTIYSVVFPWAGFATNYPDPTSQTDAFNHSKSFRYQAPWQIMDRVVDEAHRTKSYGIDNLGRRTSETISGVGGGVVQQTSYVYSGTFKGVITQKTVQSFDNPQVVPSLVTQYNLDVNGRVHEEIVDPSGLALTTTYRYDQNGNKLSVKDPRGNVTGFAYDQRNRLTKVVYADGSSKTIAYYANGLKSSETVQNFPAAQQTTYAYDTLKRLTRETRIVSGGNIETTYDYQDAVRPKQAVHDPNQHITSFVYDGLLRLTSSTDALNHTTLYGYAGANSGAHAFDSSGFKPTSIQDPRGYVTVLAYDSLYRLTGKSVQYQLAPALFSDTGVGYDEVGNPTSVTDPLLHTTVTDFDALNRPTHVHYADNTDTYTTYTSTGLKWTVKDQLNRVTETQYDGAGRPIKVLAPEVDDGTGQVRQPTTQTFYDEASNVTRTINPRNKEWDYVYDARNRKIEEHQPTVADGVSGQAVHPVIYTGYDYVGNVLWVQDARGFTTETSYDEANRPLTITAPPVLLAGGNAPVRTTTTKTYDPAGNVLTIKDGNNHVTTNVYDELNRLHTTTDAANITVTTDYDEVGNRTSVKDGLNQQTLFAYDGLNRNTTTTDAAGKIATLAYNALNKSSRTDALGQITDYSYDQRNRLTAVDYPARPADHRDYSYDAVGNLLTVTEAGKNGAADVVYTYDALYRVQTELSNGVTHRYDYDLAGNRLRAQYGLAGGGNGRLLTSSYDDLNRLETLTEGTRTTAYSYDLSGNGVGKTLPNGDVVTTHYDALGRSFEEQGVSAHGIVYHYLSLCDGVGNLRSSSEFTAGINPRKVSMSYDNADRLTAEVVTTAATDEPVSNTSYDYDAAHNRKHKTVDGVVATYTYNSLNQLTAWSDTTGKGASYGYDFNGNRTSRTVGGQADSYSYDTENRLVGLSKQTPGGSGTYGYVYDYRTRRVSRQENAAVTALVFSGGTSVQEYSGNGTLSAEYVRGSDWGGGVGGILYTMRGASASFDHYDRRGDVTSRTDSTGTVTWQASYEAFGTRTQEQGATQDRQKANTKEEDPTGLLNEGMRYRDLDTGTFITRDPAGFVDGPNLYAYVRQNPWTSFDPEGLYKAPVEIEASPGGSYVYKPPAPTVPRVAPRLLGGGLGTAAAVGGGVVAGTIMFGVPATGLGWIGMRRVGNIATYGDPYGPRSQVGHSAATGHRNQSEPPAKPDTEPAPAPQEPAPNAEPTTPVEPAPTSEPSPPSPNGDSARTEKEKNDQPSEGKKNPPGTYRPDRELPRDKDGNPVPDPDASGPHTQIGKKEGRKGEYTQGREFDKNGKPVKDIDFTDHGRPQNHPNPHQHRYIPNPSGGTPQHGPTEPLSH